MTYLRALSHDLVDVDLAGALVDAGPEVVSLARGAHADPVPDHQGLPGLPPRAPGREARRRPLAGVPAVPVRRARRVAAPGHRRPAAVRQHHDERDQPRPRRAAGRRARGAGAPQDPRRARRRPGSGRPAAQGLPRPRHRAADRDARHRTRDRRRPGDRRPVRERRDRSRRERRRRPRDRRLRVGPRPGQRVHPRPAGPLGVRADQHRRRAADVDARRRVPRQHARGVVGADHRRPGRAAPMAAWQVNGERTRPHCIMVNKRAQALHQRGRELQRARRRVPRPGRQFASTTSTTPRG